MNNPNIQRPMMDEMAIKGTVEDMIRDSVPGTEGRTRDDLEAIVGRVHDETVRAVSEGRLPATEAAAYEWRRYMEELGSRKREG